MSQASPCALVDDIDPESCGYERTLMNPSTSRSTIQGAIAPDQTAPGTADDRANRKVAIVNRVRFEDSGLIKDNKFSSLANSNVIRSPRAADTRKWILTSVPARKPVRSFARTSQVCSQRACIMIKPDNRARTWTTTTTAVAYLTTSVARRAEPLHSVVCRKTRKLDKAEVSSKPSRVQDVFKKAIAPALEPMANWRSTG